MPHCIIDASITLAWIFDEDGRGGVLDKFLRPLNLAAPWRWRLEVANAILVREGRKDLTQVQGMQYLQALESLEIEVLDEPVNRSLSQLAQLARPHQLSAYDAVYLDLAISLNLPLFTDDRNLQHACNRAGVELISPP